MLTQKQIIAYIRADKDERERRQRMYDYYNARNDILKRVMMDPSKPNNRISHGFARMIANTYAGYMHGEPVSYTGDEQLLENLTAALNYNDEQAENSQLGLDCAICGIAVEIMYTDEDSMERFARVNPIGCIDVRDGSVENRLSDLIRYYDTTDIETNAVTHHVIVYDADYITHYTSTGSIESLTGLTIASQEPHYFGDVPAVVYKNNTDGVGDFEGVITLIDAYDLMQSESLNDQEYFSDAYLMLQGMDGTQPEDVAAMKENRVLLLPTDANAGWLIKQQNDTLVENIKNRLNGDIHKYSGCPDMSDESFAGNASGVAIRYKLLQFEINAGIKEREFKRGLQRRIELLCNLWSVKGRGSFDWRNVQIRFKRALPENLLELSQALSNLGNVLSNETKRTLLPIEIDEEEETARIIEQAQANMSLYQIPTGHEMTEKDDGEQT